MTKYLSIAILITGFLVGNACGEEFTLKKFFYINPDDVNFDNPNHLISGDFKRWDGSEGKRVDIFEDYKTAKINFGNHKAKLKIGKTKANGKIKTILEIDISTGYGCKYFLDAAQVIYGQKVLSYFDKYKNIITILTVEASFEFPNNKRIRFSCFEMSGAGSNSKSSGHIAFLLGEKETIQKTLPRTMISCERKQTLINGEIHKDDELEEPIIYFIDHDDKILRYRDGRRFRGEVLRFSDDEIRIKPETNEKNKFSSTLTIDRLTGTFKMEGENANENAISAYGKPVKIIARGECKKIENTKKF